MRRPALSPELHREALAGTADPEAVKSGKNVAPTPGGGSRRIPAIAARSVEFSMVRSTSVCSSR